MDVEIERFPKQCFHKCTLLHVNTSFKPIFTGGAPDGTWKKKQVTKSSTPSLQSNYSINNQMIMIMIDNKLAVAADDHHAAALNLEQTVFRLPKINFPTFDGQNQNPRAWINKCEQFFHLCPVPESHKVLYASFHLQGRPEIWFRSYYEIKARILDWRAFANDICERFGCSRSDELGDFRNLHQSTTVLNYLEKFEEKLADVICEYNFDEKYIVDNFIAGLKDEIKYHVKMFNPTTFSEAATMARLQEAALNPIVG